MAKIVKKISIERRQEDNEANSKSNTIKKTTSQDDVPKAEENKLEPNSESDKIVDNSFKLADYDNNTPQETQQSLKDNNNTAKSAAELLIITFGVSVFDNIRNNKVFNLPFQDAQITLHQWLAELLNTYIKFEDINEIVDAVKSLKSKEELLEAKNVELLDKLENVKKLFEEKHSKLENELKETKNQKSKQDKKISSSVSISTLTQVIPDIEGFGAIKALIDESSEDPSVDTGKFIIKYLNGILALIKKAGLPAATELEKMEMLHAVLSKLLSDISELYISQRRALLDELAKIANSYMNEYIFISPEETLQIDPLIHNAKGLGGSRIKEGVSYAVLEKSTRKTVKYADIKV
jgi:hypothetical protein